MAVKLKKIEQSFEDHENTLSRTKKLFPEIEEIAEICENALKHKHKILICGNGGSAADAQHIAAEFIGRFHNERIPLPAIALTTDTSVLTSIANDYSYEDVFSRQVEGLGEKGDVFWGISTSGNSKNINQAFCSARKKGLKTVGFTGKDGGELVDLSELSLIIPSEVTARIQEMHLLCAHIICEIIDDMDWNN